MPTPDRTSLADIVRAGSAILESTGLDGLTMKAVADRVGVRPPSLYKRVRNRDDLVLLVALDAAGRLGERLAAVAARGGPDERQRLVQLADELRAFARASPVGYQLLFTAGRDISAADQDALLRTIAPVLTAASALVAEADALNAARTITAWANGFIGMELAGAFNLGGDVDEAWNYGVKRIVDALAHA